MDTNKGGRPPLENAKSRSRQIRLTQEQDDYLAAAAKEAGQTFAEYVRERILPKRLRH